MTSMKTEHNQIRQIPGCGDMRKDGYIEYRNAVV